MKEIGRTVYTKRDLTQTVLAVLLMVILIGASFWILRPFLLGSSGRR
jgi:preprotein translocase subunit SecE